MTRELPKTEPEDDEGNVIQEYIQFRGRQASVTLDDFGIRFTMEDVETPEGVRGFIRHKPLPVASAEAIRAGEAPANAVAEEVAEQITHGEISNPLIAYGVICEFPTGEGEICGDVFASPESLNGHMSTHYRNQGADVENQRDGDSSASGSDDEADPGDEA